MMEKSLDMAPANLGARHLVEEMEVVAAAAADHLDEGQETGHHDHRLPDDLEVLAGIETDRRDHEALV